jgi:hypothetical protein
MIWPVVNPWLGRLSMIGALAVGACGTSTPVVRIVSAGMPGMAIYASGISDSQRNEFEQYMRDQGNTVTELSRAPAQKPNDCTIKRTINGVDVNLMIADDSTTPPSFLGTPCDLLRNWGVAN